MMNDNRSRSSGEDEPSMTVVIPGSPLGQVSRRRKLAQLRNKLNQQLSDSCYDGVFPIPADTPLGLDVVYNYLTEDQTPSVMDLSYLATEICLGILYQDANNIVNKGVTIQRTADEDHRRLIRISIRLLE